MDQRPDQLNNEGWMEDRPTTAPSDDEGVVIAETVTFVEFDVAPPSETERIKADIEDTRAEMGQTLNEIQERLSPEHLMGQVKETVREATIGKVEKVMEKVNETISNVTEPAMEVMGRAGEKLKETGSSVTNTIRRNPIPFALVGLGVGMLIANRVRNADGGTTRSYRRQSNSEIGYGMATPRYSELGRQYGASSGEYGRTTGEYAGAARQYGTSSRSAFSQVTHTANELAHGTVDKVTHLGHQAKEGALWAGRELERLVHENPLAVGAMAVAAGAAVGLALPSTRMEHEYLGTVGEKVVDRAQQVAREAMDKVKSATQGDTGGQNQGQPQGQGQKTGQAQQPGQPTPTA